jgi:predicted metal-dependent hydrolase
VQFWGVVERFEPLYPTHKLWLREYGKLLEI